MVLSRFSPPFHRVTSASSSPSTRVFWLLLGLQVVIWSFSQFLTWLVNKSQESASKTLQKPGVLPPLSFIASQSPNQQDSMTCCRWLSLACGRWQVAGCSPGGSGLRAHSAPSLAHLWLRDIGFSWPCHKFSLLCCYLQSWLVPSSSWLPTTESSVPWDPARHLVQVGALAAL